MTNQRLTVRPELVSISVRPELVEGWVVNPFIVRQAHYERINRNRTNGLTVTEVIYD